MSETEIAAGLTLAPSEKLVHVSSRPVLDVSFTQFRATVSGTVKCMEACQPMEVTLDPVGRSESQVRVEVKVTGSEATFVFENVMPGKFIFLIYLFLIFIWRFF